MNEQPRSSERPSVAPVQSTHEGDVAKAIEQQTAKLPSDTFLWAAIGAMATAATLFVAGNRHAGLFVGQWVAPLLLFGVYNKIVKVAGSDQEDHEQRSTMRY